MKRRARPRKRRLAGLFLLALLAVTCVYIHHVLAGEAVKTTDLEERPPMAANRLTPNEPTTGKDALRGYAVIAQRNLFRHGVAPKVTVPSQAVRPAGQMDSASDVLPTFTTLSTPQVDRPTENDSPPLDQVAVVGVVKMGDEGYALLEDVAKGEARCLRMGESAFGYTLKKVSMDSAVLECEGRTFAVAIGENKADASTAATLTLTGDVLVGKPLSVKRFTHPNGDSAFEVRFEAEEEP